MLAQYPLILAVIAVTLLLILIINLRLHAFIALVFVSALTGVLGGVTTEQLLPTMMGGFGSTLAYVAMLVGLGAMIGKVLEATGGADVLANSLINRFGENNAPFALGVASLLFGFPIFFDAGLIVMLPVILSVAARFKGSVLLYALPATGAFAAMHAMVPPHPGPVVAADLLGADIGLLILIGIITVLPTWYFGSFVWAKWIGSRIEVALPELFSNDPVSEDERPKLWQVLLILVLPLLLIFGNTGINTYKVAFDIEQGNGLMNLLQTLGQTPIALLITLCVCLLLFYQKLGTEKLRELCDNALAPVCAVILVTGAGGMFGGILRATGIGDALAGSLSDLGIPVIVAAFVIAASLRVAQGSATVALTTTAALVAPMVAAQSDLSGIDLCAIVIAIAGGASVLSHFNDSGFWLVSRLFGMDETTTLQTWTPMVTLLGFLAFIFATILSIVF